jgi:predicted transcriptional regulator
LLETGPQSEIAKAGEGQFSFRPLPTAENIAEDPAGNIARKKWGHSLNAGFQIIPDVLFRCQKILGLEAADVVILLNITTHWWEYDDLPYPRPSIIAKRMNLSTRTVERRISELQEKGFLIRLSSQRKKGKTIRPYDLSGLVEKLKLLSTGNLVRRRVGASDRRG